MISRIEYNEQSNFEELGQRWKDLLRIGAFVAVLAGVLFRRNFAAEISLVSGTMPPTSALEWFTLLQGNRLLGLLLLDAFDIINYLLVGLMFLALYIPLRSIHSGRMVVATVLGIIGTAIYIASNTAFSMLSLSEKFATATTDAQRSIFLAAGEAMLALSVGTGYFVSLILLAVAGLIVSFAMLQSSYFNRTTAYTGIFAGICDSAYCITFQFSPVIAILFVSAAGLFLTIWHILVGRSLYMLSKEGPM